MQITGLNQEQIDYISEQYKVTFKDEDDFLEYIRDDYDFQIEEDSHRHWIECINIVQIGERFFGYHAAYTTGDMSASEKGFEPEDWVKEYEPVEVKTITYKEKSCK